MNGEAVIAASPEPSFTPNLFRVARPDLAAYFGTQYNLDGFDVSVESSELVNNVCLQSSAGGVDHALGCVRVDVPEPSAWGVAHSSLDSVTATAGTINASGWALLSHLPDPVPVSLEVDQVIHEPPVNGLDYTRIATEAVDADQSRPDLNPLFPFAPGDHGFSTSWAQAPGHYRVCIEKENVNGTFVDLAGNNRFLSIYPEQCALVVVP